MRLLFGRRWNQEHEVLSMRRVIQAAVLLGAVLLSTGAHAQDSPEQQKHKRNYEKALTAEFISFGGWVTDYDVARERAKKEGKLIFTFFSRSYAP
jgi:hypothetical protein